MARFARYTLRSAAVVLLLSTLALCACAEPTGVEPAAQSSISVCAAAGQSVDISSGAAANTENADASNGESYSDAWSSALAFLAASALLAGLAVYAKRSPGGKRRNRSGR